MRDPVVEGTPRLDPARFLRFCSYIREEGCHLSDGPRVYSYGGLAHGWEEVADRALLRVGVVVVGGGTALAADDGIPYESLVEVTVPSQDDVDSVVEHYDAAEYKRVEDDGAIMLNVFATAEELGRSRPPATRSAPRSRTPTPARSAWSSARQVLDEEALAADLAENGMPKGTKFQGKSVVPTPGDTVIQRAVTFTDVVGPSGGTTTARFLYVEAFNKSTKITGNTTVRPDPGAHLRGR